MWPVQNRRQNEFHNFYWQVTSVGMCDCFYENDQIFKDGAPPHGILLGFCSKLLKSLSDTFLHVFWPVLTDLRQFEIHKIFDFLGERGEKSFSRSENYFWGSVPYRPQYENISPTSQKLKSVEKKKLIILVHDLEFFQEIVRKIFWVWPTLKIKSARMWITRKHFGFERISYFHAFWIISVNFWPSK